MLPWGWIDYAWPMMAAACVTLALVHGGIWLRLRSERAALWFALAALSAAGVACVELGEMRALTPRAYIAAHYWIHLPLFTISIALAGFARAFFQGGRTWLLAAAVALRIAVLAANFALPNGINWTAVPAVRQVELPGEERASVALGTHTHWTHLDELAWTVQILFTIDAALAAWRRTRGAERRQVARVASAMLTVFLLGVPLSALVHARVVESPYFVTPFFLLLLAAMGYEISDRVVRAGQIAHELRLSEERRRAGEHELELAAARQRSELAHISRIATLGELSASIAHELNQPLGAILANAQAAQRLLERDGADVAELREIVGDIVESDRRAGEVIRRLRAMLRKEELTHVPLALDEVVADVRRIMASDFVNRGVVVETRLADGLPRVAGDRVQLQQVLLNLMINACDAMAERPKPRRLLVGTAAGESGTIELWVTDSGPGIPAGDLERVFEPFVTTKPHGTGLGLAVCRTIVEAHGGRIRARNEPAGGAAFTVTLPAVA